MKKLIFSTGLIGAALVAFSFASPQKNDAMNSLDVTSDEVEKGSCSTTYELSEGNYKCTKVWKDLDINSEGKSLDDY